MNVKLITILVVVVFIANSSCGDDIEKRLMKRYKSDKKCYSHRKEKTCV